MTVHWQDYIESDPDILKGKPRIKNTRIPVSLIFGYLASGLDNKKILDEFQGDINEIHISACLDYVRDLSDVIHVS